LDFHQQEADLDLRQVVGAAGCLLEVADLDFQPQMRALDFQQEGLAAWFREEVEAVRLHLEVVVVDFLLRAVLQEE
jgi:hypothetical protein